MKTTTLTGTLAIGILATVQLLHAQTVFDPAADFSTNHNPNGVWSYGCVAYHNLNSVNL